MNLDFPLQALYSLFSFPLLVMVWEAAKKGLQSLYICLHWKDPPHKTQMPRMRPNPSLVRFFEDEKKLNTEDSITPRHIGTASVLQLLGVHILLKIRDQEELPGIT